MIKSILKKIIDNYFLIIIFFYFIITLSLASNIIYNNIKYWNKTPIGIITEVSSKYNEGNSDMSGHFINTYKIKSREMYFHSTSSESNRYKKGDSVKVHRKGEELVRILKVNGKSGHANLAVTES